ncbi:hypothetical protein [Flavobacterium sp.]|uniref:hypothetical protein n=1 Tax=Flavobacterium sp. TaxID=239 RepID=UPI00374CB56F
MSVIRIKRKLTTGAPVVTDLQVGELCVVIPDKNLYIKTDVSTVVFLGGFSAFVDAILTGNPTAPTPLQSDNSNSIATTAFVKTYTDNAISTLVGSAPEALNTLMELATQMQNDEAGVVALTALVGTKLDENSTIDGGSF